MSDKISERAFEDAIEAALLRHGPDEVAGVAGGLAEDPAPYGEPMMRHPDPLPVEIAGARQRVRPHRAPVRPAPAIERRAGYTAPRG